MAKRLDEVGEKSEPMPSHWTGLTWDHLEKWAGSRSVSRGRTYQRGGRVKDLKVDEKGDLLATVLGGDRYATTVTILPGHDGPFLASSCTCPVGADCKHAVAVVAEYLEVVSQGIKPPVASEDDPRWVLLGDGEEGEGGWHDEDDDEDDYPSTRAQVPKRTIRKADAVKDWHARVEEHLRSQSQEELADLVCSLTIRFPAIFEEFREQLALEEGDVDSLVIEVSVEIQKASRQSNRRRYRDDWSDLPDYESILVRLDKLLDLGQADEIVELGRVMLNEGIRVAGEFDDDENSLTDGLSDCLVVVFKAVAESSLSGMDRILFAIDAELADDYGLINDSAGVVYEAETNPEDWSKVADILARRLTATSILKSSDRYAFDYRRNELTTWITTALERAGRDEEVGALYESEARETGSYDRLVHYLITSGRLDDAERWAIEGIGKVIEPHSRTADSLASKLLAIAVERKQWDVVAAHAARTFFDRPGISTFEKLVEAAREANAEAPVRASALRFLETGIGPFTVLPVPQAVSQPRGRASGKKPALPTNAGPKSEPADRLKVAPDWPLPVPDAVVPFLIRAGVDTNPRPYLSVLLDMAIAAKEPVEILRWFDRMRVSPRPSGWVDPVSSYNDRVASAVVASHPDRAIEIYRAGLDAALPQANRSAYETADRYLRLLRPIYEAGDRAGEWISLVGSIREKYRNRSKFLEILDRLEGRPIVQSTRPKRR